MTSNNFVTSLLDPKTARYDAIVPAGEPWIHEILQGQYLRIVDVESIDLSVGASGATDFNLSIRTYWLH